MFIVTSCGNVVNLDKFVTIAPTKDGSIAGFVDGEQVEIVSKADIAACAQRLNLPVDIATTRFLRALAGVANGGAKTSLLDVSVLESIVEHSGK